MLKTLLIGLDGSDDGGSALELGLRWASRFDALAIGLAVVDEPGIRTSELVLSPGYHSRRRADPVASLIADSCRRAEQVLRGFARRCGEAGVSFLTLEEVGSPFVQILMESQRCDLILLGQRTHFDYGREGEPDETLGKVLQDSPRPLVAVPRERGGGEAIVVAYDSSLQAARTLAAFEASGLAAPGPVHVVSVADDIEGGIRHADRAVEFLHRHQVDAVPHPVQTSAPAAEVILRKVGELEAGLLVMGAYGRPVLREFFVGSVTRTVLKESPVPVFCYH